MTETGPVLLANLKSMLDTITPVALFVLTIITILYKRRTKYVDDKVDNLERLTEQWQVLHKQEHTLRDEHIKDTLQAQKELVEEIRANSEKISDNVTLIQEDVNNVRMETQEVKLQVKYFLDKKPYNSTEAAEASIIKRLKAFRPDMYRDLDKDDDN